MIFFNIVSVLIFIFIFFNILGDFLTSQNFKLTLFVLILNPL